MEFFDSVIFSDGDNAMVGDNRSDSSDLEIPIEGLSIGEQREIKLSIQPPSEKSRALLPLWGRRCRYRPDT